MVKKRSVLLSSAKESLGHFWVLQIDFCAFITLRLVVSTIGQLTELSGSNVAVRFMVTSYLNIVVGLVLQKCEVASCCLVADEWPSEALCPSFEFNTHSYRTNPLLHSWELSNTRGCSGSWGPEALHAGHWVPPLPNCTIQGKDKVQGTDCFFLPSSIWGLFINICIFEVGYTTYQHKG